MLGKELKQKYLKEGDHKKFSVIAIGINKHGTYWWHIHDNEEIPEDKEIAFHLRK